MARLRTGHDDLLVDVARSAADHVCVTFGPGGSPRRVRTPGDRTGPGRVGPRNRGAALPRAGRHCSSIVVAATPWRTSNGVEATSRTTCHSGRPTRCEGMPSAPSTWPRVRSTSPWRTPMTNCFRQPSGSGATQWPDAPISPAEWDRAIRTRASARTSRCPRTGRTPRPAPRVASVMLAWRLLLATGDPTYADLAERTLYNVVAASSGHGRHGVLLHQHAAPTGHRERAGHRRDRAPRVQLDARAVVRGHLLPTQRRPNPGQPRGVSRDEGRVRNPASAVRHMPDQHHSGRRAPAPTRGRDRLPPRRFHSDPVRRPSGRPMDPDPSGPGVGARRHDHRRHRNPVGRARHHGDHRRVRTRDHRGARSSDDTATELPRPADRRHSRHRRGRTRPTRVVRRINGSAQ